MAYSDLQIRLEISITDDNSEFTVNDITGTYPESEGGYAPEGESTPERPSLATVRRWFMYRFFLSDGTTITNLPNPQQGVPSTFSNLSGQEDRIIQVVMLVVDDTFNWEELLENGFEWDDFIELATESGALGHIPVWFNINENNCVYDALFRLNNKFPANCNMEEWNEKNAMFLGTAALLTTLPPLPANTESTQLLYTEAQAQVDELVTLCNDPTCQCNC
jgi:hypothetical protein